MSKQNSSQFRYVPHAYHPGEQLPQPASVGATSAQPSSSTIVPKKRKADALDETPASATSSTPHATRPLASPYSSPATIPSLPRPKTQTGRHPTNVLANKTHHPAAAAGSPSTGVAPVTLAAKPGGRSMNRHRMTMEERKQAMVSAAAASTSSLMSPSSSTAHATTTTSSTKPTRPSKKPKNVSATPTSSSKTPLKERTPDMRTTYGDPPVQSSVHPIESVTSRPEPITQLPDPRGATSSSRSAKEVNPLPVDWKLLVNESCTTLAQSSTWTPAEAIYHRRLARVSIDKRPDSTTLAISVQRVSVQKSRQEYGEKAVSYLWLSPAGRKDPLITLSDLSYVVDLTMMHVLERRLTTDETSQIAGILDTFNPVSLASTDDWFKRLNGLHPPPFKGEPPIILFNWADLESMIELLLLQHKCGAFCAPPARGVPNKSADTLSNLNTKSTSSIPAVSPQPAATISTSTSATLRALSQIPTLIADEPHPTTNPDSSAIPEESASELLPVLLVPQLKTLSDPLTWSQSEMLNRCRTLQIVAERHPGAINLHLSSLDVQSTEASELPSTIRLNLEHLPQGRLSVQVSRRDIVKLINIAFRASDGQAQDWSRMERIARKAIATKLAEKLGPNEEDMQKMCISQEGSDIGSILDRLETTCFDSLLREVFEAWQEPDTDDELLTIKAIGSSSNIDFDGDTTLVDQSFGQPTERESRSALQDSVTSALLPAPFPPSAILLTPETVNPSGTACPATQDLAQSKPSHLLPASAGEPEDYRLYMVVYAKALEKATSHSHEQSSIIKSLRAELARFRQDPARHSTALHTLQEENARLRKREGQLCASLAAQNASMKSILLPKTAEANLQHELSRIRQENERLSSAIRCSVESFQQADSAAPAAVRAIGAEARGGKDTEGLLSQFQQFETQARQRAERAERRLAEQTLRLNRSNEVLLSVLARQSEARQAVDVEPIVAQASIPPPRTMMDVACATDPQNYESVGVLAQPPARAMTSIDISTDVDLASHQHISVGTDGEPSGGGSTIEDDAPSPTVASDYNSTTTHSTPAFVTKELHSHLISSSMSVSTIPDDYSSYLDLPLAPDSRIQRRLAVNGFTETIIKLEQECDVFLDRMTARASRRAARKSLLPSTEP